MDINGEVLVENLGEESLVSQRLVYDQLKSQERKIHEIEIPRELISCKGAHQKYELSQSKKKGGGVGSEAERKRKLKQEEIFGVKRSKMEVDRSIVTLKKDIEEKSIEASKKET